jgi:hypothetical protein
MMPAVLPEVNMYCPECGCDYRDGFTECSDCQVALLAGKPPEANERGEPDLDLVTVLEDNDPLLIGSVKGMLEEAGIPFYVMGEELGSHCGAVVPFRNPWCQVQVAVDREAEARALVQQIEEIEEIGQPGGVEE